MTGLRDRKKAKRRDDLIAAAIDLFETKGVDATTISDIAEACEVSPPTVFNYFGSKDGLLVAIIEEGTQKKRENESLRPQVEGVSFEEIVANLFSTISQDTLAIASRRVWRYAEASVIRHPETELSKRYKNIPRLLIKSVATRLGAYDLKTLSGMPMDSHDLATMLHDLWLPCYVKLITEPDTTLADHDAMVAQRVIPVLGFIFEKESLQAPRLRHSGGIT